MWLEAQIRGTFLQYSASCSNGLLNAELKVPWRKQIFLGLFLANAELLFSLAQAFQQHLLFIDTIKHQLIMSQVSKQLSLSCKITLTREKTDQTDHTLISFRTKLLFSVELSVEKFLPTHKHKRMSKQQIHVIETSISFLQTGKELTETII